MARYSKDHKARVRERIIDVAGRLFRTHGFETVGIDQVMAAASLTRGGFYNHFPNKEALLHAVLEREPDLSRRLQREIDAAIEPGLPETAERNDSKEPAPDSAATIEAALRVFTQYLEPAHREPVGRGCSLASLANEAARGPESTRLRYQQALESVLQNLDRAQGDDRAEHRERSIASIALAVGTLNLARGVADGELAEHIQRSGLAALRRELGAAD